MNDKDLSRVEGRADLNALPRRIRRPLPRVVTYAAVVAAVIAMGFLAIGLRNGNGLHAPRQSRVPQAFNGAPLAAPGEPCIGAKHSPPGQLVGMADSPVFLPHRDVSAVKDAWTCGDPRSPVFLLGDIEVTFETGWGDLDPQAKLSDLATDYGGSVTVIQGLPAWVAASSKIAANDEVLLVKGDTAIKLIAEGSVPIDQLVTLANSLDLSGPVAASTS